MAGLINKPHNYLQKLRCNRIILHFDYDCFYASVFEAENPALKLLPLCVQQKQIVVTCNYVARKRGIYKLQTIREAREKCPDAVIELGEDLSRFRDASKDLYSFLTRFVWSGKSERLGFDEVFLDVSDIITYNVQVLNHHDLPNSFFHLNKQDPTVGFEYDGSRVSGNTVPNLTSMWDQPATPTSCCPPERRSPFDTIPDPLEIRLRLGSHLARYLRLQLENQKGYTASVGISFNKMLSKLVGNVSKPRAQTTLMFHAHDGDSSVTDFLDAHEIGKIPGIGFKSAQYIRQYILGQELASSHGLHQEHPREAVTVRDVRLHPNMGPDVLGKILHGLGGAKDLGSKIHGLIRGIDNADVAKFRTIPTQISIEDSYLCLDNQEKVGRELLKLSQSLINRMYLDLSEPSVGDHSTLLNDSIADIMGTLVTKDEPLSRRWLAVPRSLRLSTRSTKNLEAKYPGSHSRVSTSVSLPSFVLSQGSLQDLSSRLVREVVFSMFKRLHPKQFRLSLLNLAVVNIVATAGEGGRNARSMDIGQMFWEQSIVPSDRSAESRDVPQPSNSVNTMSGAWEQAGNTPSRLVPVAGSEDQIVYPSQGTDDGFLDNIDQDLTLEDSCKLCGAIMPTFAKEAHIRFHQNLE